VAARRIYRSLELSQDVTVSQDDGDRATSKIPLYEATIRSLLRIGADIGRIPTDTEEDTAAASWC